VALACPNRPAVRPEPMEDPQVDCPPPGRVAQWESARFTRERSQVRNPPRPSHERPAPASFLRSGVVWCLACRAAYGNVMETSGSRGAAVSGSTSGRQGLPASLISPSAEAAGGVKRSPSGLAEGHRAAVLLTPADDRSYPWAPQRRAAVEGAAARDGSATGRTWVVRTGPSESGNLQGGSP
jgi:hypothetical protein